MNCLFFSLYPSKPVERLLSVLKKIYHKNMFKVGTYNIVMYNIIHLFYKLILYYILYFKFLVER